MPKFWFQCFKCGAGLGVTILTILVMGREGEWEVIIYKQLIFEALLLWADEFCRSHLNLHLVTWVPSTTHIMILVRKNILLYTILFNQFIETQLPHFLEPEKNRDVNQGPSLRLSASQYNFPIIFADDERCKVFSRWKFWRCDGTTLVHSRIEIKSD